MTGKDLTAGSSEALCRDVARAVRPYRAGSLAKTPLAHQLVHFEHRVLTGTLWLHDDTSDSSVLFVRGAPAKVKTTLPVPHLGALLVELGYITQRAHDETIDWALRGGGLHGAMLKACGSLDQQHLEAGLREQTALRLIEVFRHSTPNTRYAFYRNTDLLASWGGDELTPVDPWWVLWWGSRDRPRTPVMDEVFAFLDSEPILPRSDVRWNRFGFEDRERAFLGAWRSEPRSVYEVMHNSGLPADRVANLVYILFLTRCLAFAEPETTRVRPSPQRDTRPPIASATDVFRAPADAEPTHVRPSPAVQPSNTSHAFPDEEIPTDIEVEIPVILSDSVDESDVTEAMVSPPMVEQRPIVPRSMARMEQAFRTILDPMERSGSEESAPLRGPTPSELALAANADAMQLSARSIQALRAGDIDEARRCTRAAMGALPNNALLKANHAWIELVSREQGGDLRDLLELLSEATALDPALDRPYFVRGKVFQRLGMPIKAYAEFRAAFARNAHNAEAAAEIEKYAGDSATEVASNHDHSVVGVPTRAGAISNRRRTV